MAREVGSASGFVAASFDAQRGQVFGGLYKREEKRGWSLIEEEMVVAPEGFVDWVKQHSAGEMVQWISLDPALFDEAPGWKEMAARGEKMMLSADGLAAGGAELGEKRGREGEFSGPRLLEWAYVRRSCAGSLLEGPDR